MPSIASLYPEAKALCDHTNSAANEARAIWFGFLTYGTFLLVAVSGTTHKMLFLETPISLPVLSINLDLVGFYVAAPLLLVVLHLYLLVKLVLLTESFAEFEKQVRRDIKISGDREQIRKHLNTTILLQALKERHRKHRLMTVLLVTLLIVTLVAGPVFALLYTQIRFLPYQSEVVTWVHLLLLAADFVVLALAYKAAIRIGSLGKPWIARWIAYPTAGFLTLASFLLITVPGERIDANPLLTFAKRFLPTEKIGRLELTRVDWPFPTTLNLATEQFVAEMGFDLEKLNVTLQKRERRFVGANFQGADLRKAVFEDADLRGANLSEAKLQGADLRRAQLQGANLFRAELQGANLRRAQLQGAGLFGAKLQGANLSEAKLQGAALFSALLQSADLFDAKLQGANLRFALLRGANLRRAQLQGANLLSAILQGADLRAANLQGADLSQAKLQGADLRDAQLQGADLSQAKLQGADLRRAQLQGADLRAANLQGANLTGAYVWRALTDIASFADHMATGVKAAPVYDRRGLLELLTGQSSEDELLDDEKVAALTDVWLAKIPDGDLKVAAAERLKILRRDAQTPEKDRAVLGEWQAIENASVSVEQNRRARLDIFANLACSLAEDEFFTDPAAIAEAFAAKRILYSVGADLAFVLLSPKCAGHGGLSDKSKTRLKLIVAQADKSETAAQPKPSSNQ